jgi:hypothetical protein
MKHLAIAALVLLAPCVWAGSDPDTRADDGIGPSWTTGAFLFAGKPGAFGGEGSLAAQFKPTAHALYVGPHLSVLAAAADDGKARFDLNLGVAQTAWFVNAIGSGLDIDAVVVSHYTGEDSGVHLRVTPSLAFRAMPFGTEGAWSIRVGLPYDTHYKWGVQAGVTLQLNGVARLSD